MTPFREIFPHLLSADDIAGPGPSPFVVCSRPSCRYAYRTIAFTRVETPPCPHCQQPYIPAAYGPAVTHAQRVVMQEAR